MTHSPQRTGPSAAADVVARPAAARPEDEPDKTAGTVASVVVSQTRREEDLGDTVAAGVTGGLQKEGPLAPQSSQQAEVAVAEAAAKLQVQNAEPVVQRFAPVKDVKTMLQTGLFEGKQIVYRRKKDKIDLLHGVIKGSSYYCLCGDDCDKTGKELSARSFELHAKGESHNANDHIFLHLSAMSLFEMSKKLKDVEDGSMLQEIFNGIVQQNSHEQCLKKVTTAQDMSEDFPMILKRLQVLEKKMEQFENKVERIDQIQSQLNTMEKNIEFLVNHTVHSQKLFDEVSKIFGKFYNI